MSDIPVYLFTGFLESGKTKFIQETLEDGNFNAGQRTLLLVCEEGEEEFEPEKFSGKNVKIEVLDSAEQLNENALDKMVKDYKAERVLVEYNGMWMIQDFYDNMPDNWMPYQNMLFFDASTFINYNANMRGLVVDKLSDCDIAVFNRVPEDADIMDFHKVVRGTTRRSDIIYEYVDGTVKPDETEDPLPFDINAPVIEIADRDYALFYRDIVEEMKKYKGKKVKFKAIAATDKDFPARTCVLGRHIMTCCEADISYCGLVSKLPERIKAENASWYIVTASVDVKFSRLYGKRGPVFKVESLEAAEPPEDQVATFY